MGRSASRSLQVIIIVGLGAAVVFALQEVKTVTIPLLLALILASTFYPVMRWLRQRGVPSLVATLIVLFGVVLVLAGVIWMIVNAVINQWEELSERARAGFEQLLALAQDLPIDINQEQVLAWRDQLLSFVDTSNVGSTALAGVSAVGNFAAGFVLLIVILFFFLKDGPKIWEFLCRPFRGEHYERAQRVGKSTVETFGSYMRGTAAVAAVDAVGIGLGLVIMQVPLALPLSVLVFVLSFIPLVGATLAGILAALVAFVAHGPLSAVIVVGIVVLVNQLEGNLLQPVLMGRALKLHALVILLALAAGTVLAGVLGAVLAVPMVAAVWGAIKVWNGPNTPAKWARPKAADSTD